MSTSIGIIISIIVLSLIVRFVTKIIVRIIGVILIVLAVLALMYYQGWGPFKTNIGSLENLEKQYCEQGGDQDICDCIVSKLRTDLEARFDSLELVQIQQDRAKAAFVLHKSLTSVKQQSLGCLKSRQAEGKYDQFVRSLLPLNSNLLGRGQEGLNSLKDNIEEGVDSIKGEWEDLNEKF